MRWSEVGDKRSSIREQSRLKLRWNIRNGSWCRRNKNRDEGWGEGVNKGTLTSSHMDIMFSLLNGVQFWGEITSLVTPAQPLWGQHSCMVVSEEKVDPQ